MEVWDGGSHGGYGGWPEVVVGVKRKRWRLCGSWCSSWVVDEDGVSVTVSPRWR